MSGHANGKLVHWKKGGGELCVAGGNGIGEVGCIMGYVMGQWR